MKIHCWFFVWWLKKLQTHLNDSYDTQAWKILIELIEKKVIVIWEPLQGKEYQITFGVLWVCTFIIAFMGSLLSFYEYKNHLSYHILHTGPITVNHKETVCHWERWIKKRWRWYFYSPFSAATQRKCENFCEFQRETGCWASPQSHEGVGWVSLTVMS